MEIQWWDWAGIIMGAIGVVAFIMVVQPFLQMIYGKPKIVMHLAQPKTVEGYSVLECFITNYPITRGILATLGITRNTAMGMIVLFDIKEVHTGNCVYEDWPYLFSQVGDATQRVDLPAGYVPARFAIVTIVEASGEVYPGLAVTAEQRKKPALAAGLYTIAISVELGGKNVCSIGKNLVVQTADPYAYWVNS